MAKDSIKGANEIPDFFLNRTLKISDWNSTQIEYKYLVNDFEDRIKNFPNRKLFILQEDSRLFGKQYFYDSPFQYGYEMYEHGNNYSLDYMEDDILNSKEFQNLKITSAPVEGYLNQMSRGYAHAKFYYYYLSLQSQNKEIETTEIAPEFEYNSEAQKIAWLYKLDVLNTILEKCKNEDGSYNWRRSANVINSFTGINIDTIRKSCMASYNPGTDNDKNKPFNNPENLKFISEMANKFKLNKE